MTVWTLTEAAATQWKRAHPEEQVFYDSGGANWIEVTNPGPPKFTCGSDDCKRGCPETETP